MFHAEPPYCPHTCERPMRADSSLESSIQYCSTDEYLAQQPYTVLEYLHSSNSFLSVQTLEAAGEAHELGSCYLLGSYRLRAHLLNIWEVNQQKRKLLKTLPLKHIIFRKRKL